MEFWKTLTVIVSLDVQQDVVTVKKTELKCPGFCSCCDCTNSPDQNTDQNDLMAMTLDSMEHLKNNDGNALMYYLRSATDQYLLTYWIFIILIRTTVLIL